MSLSIRYVLPMAMVVMALCGLSHAWAPDGHRIVALIAQHLLTPTVRAPFPFLSFPFLPFPFLLLFSLSFPSLFFFFEKRKGKRFPSKLIKKVLQYPISIHSGALSFLSLSFPFLPFPSLSFPFLSFSFLLY